MRTVAVATAGTLVLAGGVILGQQTRQPSSQPIFTPGPAEIVGSVSITNAPTVQSQQSGMWEVRLTDPVALVIPTPEFSVVGQSYTFTWPGSDTAQTYRVLSLAGNGWVRADPAAGGAGEVAEHVARNKHRAAVSPATREKAPPECDVRV